MYAFLAEPPRKQRRLPPPLKDSPSRKRSNSSSLAHPNANISAWASKVQPGSPAPHSPPHRRPSTPSRRRASLSRKSSAGSFMVTQSTSSSAIGEHFTDLTAVGYTSHFIHFGKTTTAPSPLKKGHATHVLGSIPIPAVPPPPPQNATGKPAKRGGLSRFRSLSLLRPKKQNDSALASPVKSAKKDDSDATTQRRRAKSNASAKPPPLLANELALMQFIQGGTMEDNLKILMKEKAKAARKAGGGGREKGVAIDGVYRDGRGGIWHDADEEMEYAHLLGAEEDGGEWEDQHEIATDKVDDDFILVIGPVVKSASPKTNAYCPLVPTVRRSSTSTDPSTTSPHPKDALLSLPSRPRGNLRRPSLSRAFAHLANAPTYLIDIEAFAPRARGSKKRPAPLQLSPTQSAHERANTLVGSSAKSGKGVSSSSSEPFKMPGQQVTGLSPSSLASARREFVEDSFQPTMKV